ncbi:MAG: DUF6801 domain-containing protein [Actinoallomurus sp.]
MSIRRWTPRTTARVAAAGVIMIAVGLASGTESSASEQTADATLTYACPFPSDAQQITVKVAGTFPAASAVGRPIQPDDVTVTPALPHAALADLTKLDATSVTASARLSLTVVRNGAPATAAWSGLAAPSTPIPGSGDLPLPASGKVPSTTVTTIGPVTFIAGPLTLVLTPAKADGSATNPPSVPLTCTLAPGPGAVLATVRVTGPGGSVTPPPGTGTATPRTGTRRPADTDPCLQRIELTPVPGEAFLAGYSNVRKLGGAALLGRENGQTTGHTDLELGYAVIINHCATDGSIDVLSRGQLSYKGERKLPPAKATFLTFGFMPTTATLELTEVDKNIEIDSHSFFDGTQFQELSTVTSQLSIRVHDVLVNGEPLDVGPHCESVTPMAVTLKGKSPDYTVNTGGPLTGMVTIPPFSGCGVGEDLNPLLTASISGPDNFIKLTQGVPCTRPPDQPPINCDPIDRPTPLP